MARNTMTVTDPESGNRRRKRFPRKYAFLIGLLVVIVVAVAIYFLATAKKTTPSTDALIPPDPEEPLPPSPSRYHIFKRAAVCTDAPPCSEIGKNILEKNGSAVDATIAAMFCNGLFNIQSMGLGGGFLMTIYLRANKTAVTLNAREAAPLRASRDMFNDNKEAAGMGPLAVAVPGELKGYWEAYKRFGVLPWKDLIQPSLEICQTGFNMSKVLWDSVDTLKHRVENSTLLREMFYDENTKQLRKGGSLIIPSKTLCNTLKTIAEEGGDTLYTGKLADDFAKDLQELGTIITKEDLEKYRAKWEEPVKVDVTDDDILYSVRPPGGGAVLGFILQVLKGYKFSEQSIDGVNNTILTYHRVLEAFKMAFARRSLLGDADFVDVKQFLNNLTSSEYAEKVRSQINDSTTYTDVTHYGAHFHNQPDHGTAHISIVAPNGDAVSVTSSINFYFGSGLHGSRTGILLNNVMDDFSIPGFSNYFGVPSSTANQIEPQKRPLSSSSPSIIVNRDGEVKMVIGASGGTKITTSVALVIMRNLWFKQTVKQSVDAARIHHQLLPMEIAYEYGITKPVIDGLEKLGHKTKRYKDRGSIICALFRNETAIYANSDFRKGGEVFGLD